MQINCPTCTNGFIYFDKKEVRGVIQGITNARGMQIFSQWEHGQAVISVPCDVRLGFNDRLSLLNATARYSEMIELPAVDLIQTANPADSTVVVDNTRRFPVSPDGNPMAAHIATDRFTYTGKTQTTLIGIPTSGTNAIEETHLAAAQAVPETFRTKYQARSVLDLRTENRTFVHTEYKINTDGWIEFLSSPPDAGEIFTVLFESRPVYLVLELGHEFRDQLKLFGNPKEKFDRLPVMALCRRDFLTTDESR